MNRKQKERMEKEKLRDEEDSKKSAQSNDLDMSESRIVEVTDEEAEKFMKNDKKDIKNPAEKEIVTSEKSVKESEMLIKMMKTRKIKESSNQTQETVVTCHMEGINGHKRWKKLT